MMNLTIETIGVLNRTATEDFGKAKAMLDGINMVLGTEYEFLNKRVVFFDDTSSIARKYLKENNITFKQDCKRRGIKQINF